MTPPPRPFRSSAILLLCVTSLPPVAAGRDGDVPDPWRVLAERAAVVAADAGPAVAAVFVRRAGDGPRSLSPFADPDAGGEVTAFATGVLIAAPDGTPVVLTARQPVADAPIAGRDPGEFDGFLEVVTADGRRHPAVVRAADPRSDLAVLEFLNLPDPAPPVFPLATTPPAAGVPVVVLINEYGLAGDGAAAVRFGTVAATGRRPLPEPLDSADLARRVPTVHEFGTLLSLSVPLPPGADGGAVVNFDGELLALALTHRVRDGLETSAGFAVPLTGPFRRVVADLAAGHEAEYGLLGLIPAEVTAVQAATLGERAPAADGGPLTGAALIDEVRRDSPAARAGLRRGEWITAVDGEPVRDPADLMRLVGLTPPGVELSLTVLDPRAPSRDRVVRVRPAKWDAVEAAGLVATVPRRPMWRGLRVDWATGRRRWMPPPGDPFPRGVAVAEVSGEPAATGAGDIPVGDGPPREGDRIEAVNGRTVETPDEFYREARAAAGPVTLRLSDGRLSVIPVR